MEREDNPREIGRLEGHTEPVYAVAWTPEGDALVTAGFDATVRVWDARELRETAKYDGHSGLVLTLAIHPDGRQIASGGLDKVVSIWSRPVQSASETYEPLGPGVQSMIADAALGRVSAGVGMEVLLWDREANSRSRLGGHQAGVTALAWRPDGRQIASGDKGHELRFWRAPDGVAQEVVYSPSDAILGLAYSADAKSLYSAGSDGMVRRWKLPIERSRTVQLRAEVRAAVASADGRRVATLESDDKVRIYDATDGGLIEEWPGGPTPKMIALSADGRRVAVLGADRTIRVRGSEDGLASNRDLTAPFDPDGLALSPDGSRVAIGGRGQAIQVEDSASESGFRTLPDPSSGATTLAFLPAETPALIAGHPDGFTRVWDLSGPKVLSELRGEQAAVTCVAATVDGKRIAAGFADGSARAWGFPEAKELLVVRQAPGQVTSISLPLDGGLLVGTDQGWASLWSPAGVELERARIAEGGVIASCVLPEGREAVLVGRGHEWQRWDPAVVQVYGGTGGPAHAITLAPDATQLLVGCDDKAIRVYKVEDGSVVRTLEGHTAAVTHLALSPDGKRLVSAALDRTVRTWDRESGSPLQSFPPFPADIRTLTLGRDGSTLAVGLNSGQVQVVDLTKADPREAIVQDLPGLSGPVVGLVVSIEDRTILAASEDGTLQRSSFRAPESTKSLNGHADKVYSVAWSPDGTRLASGSGDKSLRIWDGIKAAQERVVEKAHENVVYAVTYGKDAQFLATAGDDKLVKYWNPADGKELRKSEGHAAAVYCLALRPPDGSMIASGSVDKSIKLWNCADGVEVRTLTGHPDDVYGLAWSPDGQRLASIGYSGVLIVWGIEDGQVLHRWRVGTNTPCYGIAWSPDGGRLAVACSDRTVHLLAVD